MATCGRKEVVDKKGKSVGDRTLLLMKKGGEADSSATKEIDQPKRKLGMREQREGGKPEKGS